MIKDELLNKITKRDLELEEFVFVGRDMERNRIHRILSQKGSTI